MEGKFFRLHREKLVNTLKSHGINDGVIFYNSTVQPKERFTDSEQHFISDGLFFWITGWEKPSSIILIDIQTGISTLFVTPFDKKYAIWTGPIITDEKIKEMTGVDKVYRVGNYQRILDEMNPKVIFTTSLLRGFFQGNINVDYNTFLHASAIARRHKLPHEIDNLRNAAVQTSEAIKLLWKDVKPGMMEFEVAALFAAHGAKCGAKDLSFLTIVASGQNSVYLHYTENSSKINDGDLILLDCGLFINHYAGDITRTFPANGKFSPDQKRVYNLLLAAQEDLIKSVSTSVSFLDLDNIMYEKIFGVLKALEIVPSDAEYSPAVASLFVPHSLSHNIGCNVHDFCSYPYGSMIIEDEDYMAKLEPNQVVSVEPGIYFHEGRLLEGQDRPEFEMIDFDLALFYSEAVGGIRIEDDVLVTENGCEVLSTCPKTIDEIEALMAH